MVPERAAEFKEGLNYCFDTYEKRFSHKDMGMYLKRGYDSIFTDPVMSGAIKEAGEYARANDLARTNWEGNMGRYTPKVPWYLYDVGHCFKKMG